MKQNRFIKLLASIPSILLFLYFIPFIGVCLILLRLFIYNNKKVSTAVSLLSIGLLIISPLFINKVLGLINIQNFNIPYLSDIVNSNLYNEKFIRYSKLLMIVSILFFIISFAFKSLINKIRLKFNSEIREYISRNEQKAAEISEKNDLIMKEKREKAKNTHVVYCPYCGSDNLFTEKTGICKFCRRKIEYKE